MPPRMSRATSRSPPAALRARLAFTPRSHCSALACAVVRDQRRRPARCCRGAGRSGCRPCPSTWGRPGPRSGRLVSGAGPCRHRARARASRARTTGRRRRAGWRGSPIRASADFTDCVTPPSTRSTRLPMSTVISTSAGERAPSAFTRSSRPSLTNTRVDLDAALGAEGVEQRLDQRRLARGVERELPAACAGRAARSERHRWRRSGRAAARADALGHDGILRVTVMCSRGNAAAGLRRRCGDDYQQEERRACSGLTKPQAYSPGPPRPFDACRTYTKRVGPPTSRVADRKAQLPPQRRAQRADRDARIARGSCFLGQQGRAVARGHQRADRVVVVELMRGRQWTPAAENHSAVCR